MKWLTPDLVRSVTVALVIAVLLAAVYEEATEDVLRLVLGAECREPTEQRSSFGLCRIPLP